MNCLMDRQFSTEQEAKSIYAVRATRGHRFGGVPTTPRGRDFSYLCYSLAKSHVNGWGCSGAWIIRVFGL